MFLFCGIILILLLVIICWRINKENFAGALTQLYAKGPQDLYLTGNVEKYIPPFLVDNGFMWNQPTRLAYPYYYPLWGIYPYNFTYYPIGKY